MKKAFLLAATLALFSAPALAQKGGGGVQEGGRAIGETVNAGTQGRGMRTTTGASRSSKSKKAKRTKTR